MASTASEVQSPSSQETKAPSGKPDFSGMAAGLAEIVAKREATESGASSPASAGVTNATAAVGDQPLGSSPTSLFEQALKEDAPSAISDPNEGAAETIEEVAAKKSSGYQKLKAQNAELQQMAQQFQQQLQGFSQQVAPEISALREQNAQLQQQMQFFMQQAQQQQQRAAQPQVDPNDPFVQLQEKLSPAFQQQLSPVLAEIQQLRQEAEQLKADRQQQIAAQERAAKKAEYQAQTQAALQNVLLNDAEVKDPDTTNTLSRLTTALALLDKTSAEEAARKIRRSMLHWAQGFESTRGKQAREKMASAAKLPLPPPDSTTRAEGQAAAPSHAQLAADGRFKNQLAWRMAGSPSLRK
jgi:hypothetical protein